MKKTSKWLALLLALAMSLSLAACSSPSAENSDSAGSQSVESGEPENSAPAGDKKYVVGISQFVTHDALDAATQGFIDAMNNIFGEDGWEYDLQNAAKDPNMCSTIATTFVSKKVDLIMANATPALQAAAAATGDIPILGTSVTEYGVAHLKGETLRQRARNLIAIAHPDFRAPLIEEFEKRFHCAF